MAGIKQPILDIMQRVRDTIPEFLHVRVWNNQLSYNRSGQIYEFLKPACFVEVINSPQYEAIGGGWTGADLGITFHIVHEHYDSMDGTFEQDLVVFDLRDKVLEFITLFKPSGCSHMTLTGEEQDYEHDNLYHYQVSFVCNFTDNTGAIKTIEVDGSTIAPAPTIQFIPPINNMPPYGT